MLQESHHLQISSVIGLLHAPDIFHGIFTIQIRIFARQFTRPTKSWIAGNVNVGPKACQPYKATIAAALASRVVQSP
jgi:hypothetical protein